MRSGASPRRRRLLLIALGLALLLWTGGSYAPVANAQAEIDLPPPALDQWPAEPGSECGNSAQRRYGPFSEFCGFWHACETQAELVPGEQDWSARERDWCLRRASWLDLRQRCYGPSVLIGERLTARNQASEPGCRSEFEDIWQPLCIDGVATEEMSQWACQQTQAIFPADWEEGWRRHDCMALIDSPGRVEEQPEESVEFCAFYGPERYQQLCRGSAIDPGTLPTRPTDRDRFCQSWGSNALNPNGGCEPTPSDAAESERCRDYNEGRWRELGCSATNVDNSQDRFCWSYGWQRYDDFCRRDTAANPNATHRPPFATPPGEERPPGIENFCSAWESGPWAEGDAPPGINDLSGDPASGADQEPLVGAPDVFTQLGGQSPFCRYPERLSPSAVRACQLSGSIAHQYPIAHYGLDYHSGPDGEASLTDIDLTGISTGLLQTVLNLVWMAFVYLLKAILALLEWAFEVPVIGGCGSGGAPTTTGACDDQFSEIPGALLDLHGHVRPWLVVAFAVTGLWGLWNGLVRNRVSETVAGLLGTVALMGVGLAIVNNPVGTVGWVARMANDASLGVLTVASRAGADNPIGSFADAEEELFDTLVTRPWCALQFGDVAWCTTRSEESGIAPADVWLAWEAGGPQRAGLYDYMKGRAPENAFVSTLEDTWAFTRDSFCIFDTTPNSEGESACDEIGRNNRSAAEMEETLRAAMGDSLGGQGELANMVSLQEQQGTPTRAPLLVIVVFTQTGAIFVVGGLGVRLVFAALWVLVLLLLTAPMTLAPGFGEAGRNVFGLFLRRLVAAAFAKLVLALVLMVVLLGGGILAGLGLGWLADWLLQAAFWWGIFLKREQLAALANFDLQGATSPQGGGGRGFLGGVMGGYVGYALMTGGAGRAVRAAGAPVRAMRAGRQVRRQAEGRALRGAYARNRANRASQALRQRAGVIDSSLRRVRRQQAANRAHLDRLQEPPEGMRNRRDRLENKRRGLEQLREQRQQEAHRLASRLAHLDAERAGIRRRHRRHAAGSPSHDRHLALFDAKRDLVAGALAEANTQVADVDRRLEQLDPHLKRANEQVANYDPRNDSVKGSFRMGKRESLVDPAPPEVRREVDRLDQEGAQLEGEERRLLAEQAWLGSAPGGQTDPDWEPSAAQQRHWWEERDLTLDERDSGSRRAIEGADMAWDEYKAASPKEQEAMRARAQQAMDEDGALRARFDADPPSHFTPEARSARDDPTYRGDRERFEEEEERRREERG